MDGMRLNLDFSDWEMSDRFFYAALLGSLLFHLGAIVYLSSDRVNILHKPAKVIEVTYETIKTKPVREMKKEKPIEAVKEAARKVEILEKAPQELPVIGEKVRDMSKLSDHLRFEQKESPKIKTFDMSRQIVVEQPQNEKISDPSYMRYNQDVRQKIKMQAYSILENSEISPGRVYLSFMLSSNGSVQDVRVNEKRSYASEELKAAAVRSLKQANPFPPFPKGFNYKEFTFNIVIS